MYHVSSLSVSYSLCTELDATGLIPILIDIAGNQLARNGDSNGVDVSDTQTAYSGTLWWTRGIIRRVRLLLRDVVIDHL